MSSEITDTNGAAGVTSACDSSNPSLTSTRKDSMRTPEEKLIHFDSRAKTLADNQQFDACIQDLVRCIALTKLVYGDGDRRLKLAQAHARLANAYLYFKGWGKQAQEHGVLAREMLPHCPPLTTSREDRVQILACLLSIHLTQGGASLLTANLQEAEASYVHAEATLEELHQEHGIDEDEKKKTELEISTSLSRVFQRLARPEEALERCQRYLHLLEGQGKPQEICSVYKDMAFIEQARGRLDGAIAHLSEAHAIALSQIPGGLEGARVAHSLAMVLSATAEPRHNDSAAHYFEESLCAFRSSLDTQDTAFLTVQDDFCHFLLLNGQKERCVELQRSSLTLKRSTFGDFSAEVADTLQLIGGVEMTQGKIKQAYRNLRKCLETQRILYGPQHRKTKATQSTVDMLARAPDVQRQSRQGHEN